MDNRNELGNTFDTVVDTYDKMRPGYPDDLYQAVFDYVNINETSRVLEIGSGSGQATEPVLRKGCALTAVEYGENFSEILKNRGRRSEAFRAQEGSAQAPREEDHHDRGLKQVKTTRGMGDLPAGLFVFAVLNLPPICDKILHHSPQGRNRGHNEKDRLVLIRADARIRARFVQAER